MFKDHCNLNFSNNRIVVLRKAVLLLTASTFAWIGFYAIKGIIIAWKKVLICKEIYYITPISKQEKEEIQNSISKFQMKPLWTTPSSGTSLFTSKSFFSKNGFLVDPNEYNEQLCYPIPNQWVLHYNLDYTNPNILSEDPSENGFTNLEKWLGNDPYKNPGSTSFDPNDPESRPLLWTKLRCYSNGLCKKKYHFYFIGIETELPKAIFLLQSDEPLPDLTSQGKNILSRKIIRLQLGEKLRDIPLQLIDFKKETTVFKEIDYDTTQVTLINTQSKEEWTLIKKSRLYPFPTTVEILENITLEYTLESPSRKINLKCGDTFLLESRALKDYPNHKEQESYKLVRVDSHEALLEREGYQYAIPILP